jgi:hypothetical protein
LAHLTFDPFTCDAKKVSCRRIGLKRISHRAVLVRTKSEPDRNANTFSDADAGFNIDSDAIPDADGFANANSNANDFAKRIGYRLGAFEPVTYRPNTDRFPDT